MDQNANLSEVRPAFSELNSVRNLNFRLVRPMNTLLLSDEEIEWWWQRVKTQEYMFTDFERGNREGWIARFLDMRHLHLDFSGDGYCFLANAWCCDTPELHYCIWNSKRSAAETVAAANEIVNFVFGQMHATRLGSFIPETHKAALKLSTIMGFKYEGCIRKAYRFFDKSYDVLAFGLLKEEWEQRVRRQTGANN